jgi:hypothetical protein
MTVVPLFVSLSAIFVCGAIAQAATEYRAFQIARPSADHVRLEVVSEGLDRLAQVTGRLAIVGVVGAFHSGKSFLLNALLRSLQQPASAGTADSHKASSNQFAVADQVSPKTMGLWLLETDVRLRDGSRVVLLDSEGFFAHNVDESYDAEVFTIAALASSTLIFNAVSVIDQAAVEHLEILARRAQLFQVKSAFRSSDNVSDPQFQVEFPHLIVAVEDFVQSLGALSADQWLEQYLAGHRDKSNAAAVDAASIHDVFPKGVACKTLFLPSTELDDLQHLNIDSSPLTKRFLDDVFELRDMVLAKTSAKVSQANVELGVGDGRATAALLHFLLAHINKDTFPSVPSLWSAWLTDLQRHSETEVKAFVADRLAHYIDGAQPPRSQAEFDAHAVQVLQQAESFLKSMLFGIESVYGIVLAQLRRFAADQQRQLAARNAQTIVAYVEQVAKELAARAERHSLHVPLDPALIDAESARTLAEVGALFAAQTNKYGGAAAQPAIESQRQLLTHGVAQTFAALAAANERRLAAIFDGALIKCADAFKLTQATALVELPKALPEAGEPLLTGAQIEQLATACDDACDKAAAEHCSNEGKVNVTVHAAWLSRMAVYSTYAAASTERKNVLRHALRTSNTENVCRYANKQSSKYAEEARAAVDQIFPFPDEEEIVAGKVAPLLEQATHRFTAHLAPLVQFACVSDNRVLNSALTAIHEDKLRYNLDAVKAAAHSALEKCAKPLVVALNCGMFCAASLSAWTFESRATAIALACFDKDVAARKFTDSLRRKVAARWLHTDMSSIFTDIAWRQRVVFGALVVVAVSAVWRIVGTTAQR